MMLVHCLDRLGHRHRKLEVLVANMVSIKARLYEKSYFHKIYEIPYTCRTRAVKAAFEFVGEKAGVLQVKNSDGRATKSFTLGRVPR